MGADGKGKPGRTGRSPHERAINGVVGVSRERTTREGGLLTMSRRRSKVSNQKGFTLIEIIAVLVILGILAAVAIPRFMDLTSVASEKAAMQGVSEGKSRMSNQFARNLLTGDTDQNTTANLALKGDNSLSDAGDYKLKYSAVTTRRIRITASGVGSVKGTATGSWVRPQ